MNKIYCMLGSPCPHEENEECKNPNECEYKCKEFPSIDEEGEIR